MPDSPLLIAAEGLFADRNYRFLDATILLPGQKGDPEAAFVRAHLPGARRFDIDRISDPDASLPHMLPTAAAFAKAMGALGLSDEDTLVFYDRAGSIGACRAWWMSRVFGHRHAFVLDGGLEAWRAAGGPLVAENDAKSEESAAEYRVRPQYRFVAGMGDVLEAVEQSGTVILDARNAARFAGHAPEPRPGVRGGHMPGSVNIPYTDVLDEDGRFLAPEKLRGIFTSAGCEGRAPITTCGSGLTAATLTVGLAIAGLPIGRLYDGSWAEWGADCATPVVTIPHAFQDDDATGR